MDYAPVKGTHDVVGQEAVEQRYIEAVLAAAAELYGYKEIIPPVMEYTEVFSRGTGGSSDIVRKEMYTFNDKAERSVTLRPEFTAGVARAIVTGKLYATMDAPIKLYYHGPAFRYERPQLGRYRQFNQFGLECLGLDSPYCDAECILLAMQAFSMLGFKNLHLKVNTIGDEETRKNYRAALKEYFAGHIDEMCGDCHERLELNPMRILDCKVEADQKIAAGAPKIEKYLSKASEERYYKTLSILNDFGLEYEKDDELVRGLDYYSEVVFEIHATSPSGTNYGALCGGGHYGGLIEQFGGPVMAGVGFGMGIERIQSVMSEEGLLKDLESGLDIYVMPVGEEALQDSFQLTEQVRLLGYSAENPLEALKMGSMFKKAEKRNAKFALILGTDEVQKGIAQLKNLKTKEQKEITLSSLEEDLDKAFDEAGYNEEHHD
jgi:histidyl-tRNA synthetase